MKVLVTLLVLTITVCDKHSFASHTAYGYFKNIGIPEGERIRKVEEQYMGSQRIIGGVPASLGQYPFVAGLLSSIFNVNGTSICGGSVLSADKIITAAHCWNDGINQAWKVTVVLGSVMLFSGGIRMDSNIVFMHPNWSPQLVRNDIAVINLPDPITFSATVAPISLPAGDELNEDFVGLSAIAVGFGRTSKNYTISSSQFLSHVRLNIISNKMCFFAYPLNLQSTNICTGGLGPVGTCDGDSGGPLVITRDGRQFLIGITSFGSALGCEASLPSVFARITSFISFINQHT